MREGRGIVQYLADMVEAADAIRSFIRGMSREAFDSDKRTQDAVIRNLEVIGEAVKNIPDAFKKEHPEISWHSIAAMRDKLIHGYFGVDADIVWRTVTEDLPALEGQVRKLRTEVEDRHAPRSPRS